jgi:predicted PurR-regulated permease PerM
MGGAPPCARLVIILIILVILIILIILVTILIVRIVIVISPLERWVTRYDRDETTITTIHNYHGGG